MSVQLKDVLDAFDSLGGSVNQPMALQLALTGRGFDTDGVVDAINAALASGHLLQTPTGGLRKP